MAGRQFKIGWIGLGVMGAPMAGFLAARADTDVTVYNRTAAKAQRWIENHNGKSAETIARAVDQADFIFTCVGDDPDLDQVMTAEGGILSAIKPGAIVIDHTTTSAGIARRLSGKLAARRAGFIDAPASGGQVGAETGLLTIMAGGEPDDFHRAEELLQTYAKKLKLMGPVGSGQLTKMVNQICFAGIIQSLAEGLNFADRAGLDVADVIEVISQGAAQSWQMDNRWQTMRDDEFDFGFAIDWMRKDLKHCMTEARENGAGLPVAEMVDRFYAELQETGGGRMDTSSLIRRLRQENP